MLIIDSSVLIAAFRTTEKHHPEALKILQMAKTIIILDYVISEVATVLKIRENKETASQCLEFLEKNKEIEIKQTEKSDFKESIKFFKTNKNKLSFVDTVLLIISKNNNLPLATFDKELGKHLKK